jgi:hypothetical protein
MILLIFSLFVMGLIQHIFFPETITGEVNLAIAPWAIMAGVGALKGGLDARRAKKQQAKNDAFRKTAIAMSPWTGMGDPGYVSAGNTDTMSGVLGGGVQGAALGSMAQSGGLFGKEAAKDLSFFGAAKPEGTTMLDPGVTQQSMEMADPSLGNFGMGATQQNVASAGAMGAQSPWQSMSQMDQLKMMGNPMGSMLKQGLMG